VSLSSTSRRALVLASGDFPKSLPSEIAPAGADLVVCVDGGLVHCLGMGWEPGLLIGDFDSVICLAINLMK